ncbi:YqhG family protein [Paenibacillus sediminis]|uniref:Apoptosis regulator Bcl-2 family BH4 domain-containing protein n=1 Tax=Paenibacillus sediminis TaxID=664909 RepID=A0ABS4H6A3_9BACL|nr:YqhG family protein [Paenibacillus sediminis]MBP1938057.1 hypothetical protein [Paenibacillus sediminis]
MTMTPQQIQNVVMTYLEATESQIIEKSPMHVTVKLSPRADRELTNRPYYWNFVDRVGVEPETMSFTFIFDPERYKRYKEDSAPSKQEADQLQQDPLLGRYFGAVQPLPKLGGPRIIEEEVSYGSRRLHQIFAAVRSGGSYVYLFQEAGNLQRTTLFSAAYEPWLGVCFKVEYACDVKKEELHFLGISLVSGRIVEHFGSRLNEILLTPRLPENVHIQPTEVTMEQARDMLENFLTQKIAQEDYTWANQATSRLEEELSILEAYYKDLLSDPDEEKKQAIREQYEARRSEITWQYEPRLLISVINCGIFHLR